jgi:hypothetical protein
MTAMEQDLLVLHGLAVRKSGTADQVARVLGQSASEVQAALDRLATSGDVVDAKELFMPTPAGRQRLATAYSEQCASVRADETFIDAFERFEAINTRILALFTRWQTISRAGTTVPNDHTDVDYDAKVIDDLGDIHERAETILAAFAKQVPRFAAYAERLDEAFEKALTGEHQFVSGVRVDSYHTVWHELHEDLLTTLGRSRKE